MKTKRSAGVKFIGIAIAAGLMVILGSGVASAQDAPGPLSEKFTGLGPGIQMLRTEIGQNRRDIVAASMLLTPSEGQTFWPLYDEYRAAQHKVGDAKLKLIADFAAHRDAMSEEEAQKLTKDALALARKRIDLQEDFIGKMSKSLSARTVARFFQIDNKLDVAVDARIAAKVPLVK